MRPTRRILGAAAFALLGLAPAQAQQVTLEVLYAFPAFAKFHEPIAAEFMKRQPNIKIQFRAPAASYDEGHQTMLRQAVTNQLPDLYFSGYHLLAELVRTLVKRQQVVDLDPMLAAEPAEWRKANYSDAILSLGRVDGKLYGMAFNASSPMMYFNTELVKKAGGDPAKMPDTWDDVLALAAKIKATGSDVAGVAYNVHDWPDDWLLRAMILQGGGKMLDAEREQGRLRRSGRAQGAGDLAPMVTEGGMPLIDWDQSRQQFIAGKIGLFFDTPARMRQVTDLIGDKFMLGTDSLPDRRQGERQAADRRQRGDRHLARCGEAEGRLGVPEIHHRPRGAEDRRRDDRLSAHEPAHARAGIRGTLLRREPELPHGHQAGRALGALAGLSRRQFGAHLAHAARDHQRASCAATTSPQEGLEKLVNETSALMK